MIPFDDLAQAGGMRLCMYCTLLDRMVYVCASYQNMAL